MCSRRGFIITCFGVGAALCGMRPAVWGILRRAPMTFPMNWVEPPDGMWLTMHSTDGTRYITSHVWLRRDDRGQYVFPPYRSGANQITAKTV